MDFDIKRTYQKKLNPKVLSAHKLSSKIHQPVLVSPPPKGKGKRSLFQNSLGYYKLVLFGILLFTVLVIFAVVEFLPRASLSIKSRTEPLTRDFEIKVNASINKPDLESLSIPGKLVAEEVSGKKKLLPTGTKNIGKQASGFVYIYNFSKNSLILKAKTTTLTGPGGLKYALAQDVGSIRPTAKIGGQGEEEIDESSLIPPVPIVAIGSGDQYNLEENVRIEIDNAVFGAQPKILYAMTSERITGGSSRQVKVVSEVDIKAGYELLSNELLLDVQNKLAKSTPEQVLLISSGVVSETKEQTSSAPVGSETKEFEVQVVLQVKALTYSQDDLTNLVTDRISRLLQKNKHLGNFADHKFISTFRSVDVALGRGTLNTHFEGKIEYQINREDITNRIKGKTRDEIRELLLSRPDIESVEVRFWPFWVKTAPNFQKKITIDEL